MIVEEVDVDFNWEAAVFFFVWSAHRSPAAMPLALGEGTLFVIHILFECMWSIADSVVSSRRPHVA